MFELNLFEENGVEQSKKRTQKVVAILEMIPAHIRKLLNERGITTIYSHKAISKELYLIQTNDGLFKYTDTLYLQTRPRGEKWRNCQTGEVHRGLFNTKKYTGDRNG